MIGRQALGVMYQGKSGRGHDRLDVEWAGRWRAMVSRWMFVLLMLAAPLAYAEGGEHAAAVEAGGEPAAGGHAPEIPNLITMLNHFWGSNPIVHFLHTWENQIFALVIVALLVFCSAKAARPSGPVPNRFQSLVESIVEWLDEFFRGILGAESRRYLPFLGSLFLYIVGMNFAGLVPGLKSPTSSIVTTGSLAFCVFVFVQYTAIRRLGLLGFVDHLAGEPRDAAGWVLAPLMLVLHIVGEIVKPVSLALRLFGNITGEDILLGVFLMLGALAVSGLHLPIGIPFHLPFMLLSVIFSFVQALVFTLLSTIYIFMVLPHHEAHAAEHQPSSHHP